MLKDKTFAGTLKKITRNDKFVTLVFKLDDDSYGFTFSGPKYRNYTKWKNYEVGDFVKGLRWHNKLMKRIDADSPILTEHLQDANERELQ